MLGRTLDRPPPESTRAENPRERSSFLERALLFTLFAHAAAMISMALLLPGLPGGIGTSVAARAGYVAHHPWLWRIGWLPWQITAASDLLLGIALLRTPWIPRLPAVIAVLVTIAAIIPDQTGQFLWTWAGNSVAWRAVAGGSYERYAQFESHTFHFIAGWGTIGYLAGALCWTWCFAATEIWSRRLTWLSIATWGIFALATAGLMLAPESKPIPALLIAVSLGNAIAFVLLMIWLGIITESVMRLCRPETASGRFAPWRHPQRGILSKLWNLLASSRLARAIGEYLPALPMTSNITSVVYVNYLIDAYRIEEFVTPPLKLQRLGPNQHYALFTILSFRHGHFGPSCFGRLRRWWPSPIQSNWRIHVYDPKTGSRGIQFLTIAIDSLPHALAARLLAENVPMHVPASAGLAREADGTIRIDIDPGNGSAPDLHGTFRPAAKPVLQPPWSECFGNWHEMLAYCVPQDRAMSAQPGYRHVTRQEITLNIPLESCRPLEGKVTSAAADRIAGVAQPLCFLVDGLTFRMLAVAHDKY